MVGLLAITFLPLAWPFHLPMQFWIKKGIWYLLWIGIFYLNSNIFVPRVLYKKKSGLFVVVVFISLVLVAVLNNQIDTVLGLPSMMNSRSYQTNNSYSYDYFNLFIVPLVLFGVSTIVSFKHKISQDDTLREKLEKDKITSELSFLKAQLNPHFFFNTLHTIYALTDINVKTAKDSLYTLSHMMRYVLYETKNDIISLQKEIDFIEDYIRLMRLRLDDRTQVIFDKPQTSINTKIAPMLLLPFVENAFKHGVSSIHPSYIYIGISAVKKTMVFEVRNTLFDKNATDLDDYDGIGLANTRRRLNLIYPDRFELRVGRDRLENEFTINLKLELV
jgi:LytS/YehU family sensor histidine kinase